MDTLVLGSMILSKGVSPDKMNSQFDIISVEKHEHFTEVWSFRRFLFNQSGATLAWFKARYTFDTIKIRLSQIKLKNYHLILELLHENCCSMMENNVAEIQRKIWESTRQLERWVKKIICQKTPNAQVSFLPSSTLSFQNLSHMVHWNNAFIPQTLQKVVHSCYNESCLSGDGSLFWNWVWFEEMHNCK